MGGVRVDIMRYMRGGVATSQVPQQTQLPEKIRLEEPGGGWRMEVLNNPLIFVQTISNQFVS